MLIVEKPSLKLRLYKIFMKHELKEFFRRHFYCIFKAFFDLFLLKPAPHENKPQHSWYKRITANVEASPCIWQEDEVDLINCDDTVDRWTRLMGYVRGMMGEN